MNTLENTAVVIENPTIDESLEALQADLDRLGQEMPTEIVEADEPANGNEEGDQALVDALAELENDVNEVKGTAYAEQESKIELDPEATATVTSPTPAKARKASTPRAPRGNVADLAPANFVLVTGDADRDLDELKAETLALRPTAKKIAEKFDNLFLALGAGKKPSTYVCDGFKALQAAGAMTGPEMVKALQAEGYTIGTARSQSQQVIALFLALKIGTKNTNQIVLNGDSVIAKALEALVA